MNFKEYDDPEPQDKAAARKAAELRLLGESQDDIADELDVTQPTISRWTRADWWMELLERAADDFNDTLVGKAKRELLDALESDDKWATRDARWLLERLEGGDYLPPKQRIEQEIHQSIDEDDEDDPGEFISGLTDDEFDLYLAVQRHFEQVGTARLDDDRDPDEVTGIVAQLDGDDVEIGTRH